MPSGDVRKQDAAQSTGSAALRQLALLAALLAPAGASAATCTWNNGVDSWDNPSAWSGCAGGAGNVPDTPGPGDVAVIGGGVVAVQLPESVDTLQQNGGSLFIDAGFGGSLDVITGFDWTGGAVDGFSGTLTLQSGSVSNWTGGDKTIRASNALSVQGTVNWSAGLIHLEDAVINVGATGVWNWNFNGPTEYIDITAGTFGQVFNEGQIVKTGISAAEIRLPVSLDGDGSVDLNVGTLLLGGFSNSNNSFNLAGGTTLFMTDAAMLFDSGSSFTGAGSVQFGRPGDPPGCNVTINGGFAVTGNVRVESCDVGFGNAGVSFVDLEMLDGGALLGGPAPMDVSGSFSWAQGTLIGGPGETFTINNGATSIWSGPAMAPARSLLGRQLINQGSISVVEGNNTEMAVDAVLTNGASGVIDFNFGATDVAQFLSDASSGLNFVNQGSILLNGGTAVVIDTPFSSSGTVDINAGELVLRGAGSDSGSYTVNGPGTLAFEAETRTLLSGSSISGDSVLFARDSAEVTLEGGFTLPALVVGGATAATVNWNQAALWTLDTLDLFAASTLSLQANLTVNVIASLVDGSIDGPPGTVVTLAAGSNAFFPSSPGQLLSFDDASLNIAGIATWQGGDIHFDNQASLLIDSSGDFGIEPVAGVPLNLGCSNCLTPSFINLGLIRKTAIGTGDDVVLNPAATFQNEGIVDIQGGEFQTHSYNQLGSLALTEVRSSGQLTVLANDLVLDGGTLRGAGLIEANVQNNGATVQPGASPGILNISGDYTQAIGGSLQMELGGASPGLFDQVLVTGDAVLAGTLDVLQFGPFTPSPVDSFVLLQAASLSGTVTLNANAFPSFALQFNPTQVVYAEAPAGGPLTVNSTADPGDGVCDIVGIGDGCTLREAIDTANAALGPDIIEFDIPGGGVQTIAPSSPLPTITEAVVINGYTQPTAIANSLTPVDGGLDGTLLIELSGANTTGNGLTIDAGFDSVTISGLVINRWSGAGIAITASQRPAKSTRGPSTFVEVFGNYIGTSADGLSVPGPQGNGVVVNGPGPNTFTLIGGISPQFRNLISGNSNHGIVIGAPNVSVAGNLIGTDASGLSALGNARRGIFLDTPTQATGLLIGDLASTGRNIIAGNGEDGIALNCAPAITDFCFNGSSIFGNYIGVGVDGTTPIPNANGINVLAMTYGRVDVGGVFGGAGNKIHHNLGSGILSAPFTVAGVESDEGRMQILGNSFLANGALAIDLNGDGRDINDVLDTDEGFNNGQNFPQITALLPDIPGPGDLSIEYRVDTDLINAAFPLRVEFYRAVGDEGFEFLGADSYNPPMPSDPQQFALPGPPSLLPDDVIIATATDGNGKSSEFSYYPVTVQITDDSPDPSIIGDPYTVEVTVTADGPFEAIGPVSVGDGIDQLCGFSLTAADAGVGSCVLPSPAAPGNLILEAIFEGEETPFATAFDPDGEPHTVGNPTVTTITGDAPDPSGIGDPYVVSVSVTAASGTAAGSIDVVSTDGANCSFVLSAGSGSCALSGVATGLQTLTASYLPDAGFDASSDTEPHTVALAQSSTTITSALPDPSTVGAAVTVIVQVAPVAAGNPLTPTGAVTVSATTGENCVVAALDAAGSGSCDLVFNTLGLRSIGASYAGDGSFSGSVSAGEPHEVTNLPPESTSSSIVSTTPSPSVVGQPYLVEVSVSGALGGTPCGEVLLTQLPDAQQCTATLAAGATPGTAVGSCTLTAPNAITKAITGSYQPGACNFAPSNAPLFTHPVLRAATSVSVSGQSPNPSDVGQLVTVSFAVNVQAPGAGAPSGTVTVTDGIDVCQAPVSAGSCQIAFKTEGTRQLTVSYGGDADFNASSTTAIQQVIAGGGGSGADLAIRKRNDRCTLPGGNRISYLITVDNLGPEAVSNARVTDPLPAQLSNPSWTCTASGGASCNASGSSAIDQLVNLPAGASVEFNLQVDVQATPEVLVSNTATVTAPTGVNDPVAGNNSSTDVDPIGVYCDGMEAPFED